MWCHFQGVISTEENIIVYCRQIFDALVYLHERYVCNDLLLLEGLGAILPPLVSLVTVFFTA